MFGPDVGDLVIRTFGDLRYRTDGEVAALALGEDGILWSVEEPGVLRGWEPTTGQQRRWASLSDLETLWAFGPGGRVLAAAGDDLSLWDVGTCETFAVLDQPSWVTAVAITGGERPLVATGHDDGVVRLWRPLAEELVRELAPHEGGISALAFSRDCRRLAAAGEDRRIHLWNVGDGRKLGTLRGHTDRIVALAWGPSGDWLVSAGWDTTARLWDTARCEPIILLNAHAEQVTAMALSADGSLLACGDSEHAIYVWEIAGRRIVHVLKGHAHEIRALAFRHDGGLLASGGADRTVHCWDPLTGRLLLERSEEASVRHRLALRPDGLRLASGTGGTGVRVWDTSSGAPNSVVGDGGRCAAVAWGPDGRLLASGGEDCKVRLWDAVDGRLLGMLEGPKAAVSDLALSPNGALLAAGSEVDGLVWLWDVEGGRPVLVIPEAAGGGAVEAVAFSPREDLLAVAGADWLGAGGADGGVCVWDVTRRERVAAFEGGASDLVFHPSGRLLAAASLVRSVYVWDVAERTLVRELTGFEEAVNAVAFSPNGRWLAVGSDDHTLSLWDADTSERLAVREMDTRAKDLVFAPDGRWLFTANGNGTCHQLNVQRLIDGGIQ